MHGKVWGFLWNHGKNLTWPLKDHFPQRLLIFWKGEGVFERPRSTAGRSGSLRSKSHLSGYFIPSHPLPASGFRNTGMHPGKRLVLYQHSTNALWMPCLIFLLRCHQLLHEPAKNIAGDDGEWKLAFIKIWDQPLLSQRSIISHFIFYYTPTLSFWILQIQKSNATLHRWPSYCFSAILSSALIIKNLTCSYNCSVLGFDDLQG